MNDFVLKWNNNDSIIAEAFVSKSPDGKPYAILKANPQHADKVGSLQDNLYQDRNLDSYPKIIDGEACLVVDKFHKMEDLQSALKSVGATSGEPNIDAIKGEKKNFGEMWEEFRHNGALKASGFFGLAGHGLMAVAGFGEEARWDPKNIPQCLAKGVESKMIMSLLYMVNSGLYFHYGNGDRGLQIDDVLSDVDIMLKKSGVDLQKTSYEELRDRYEKDKPFAKKVDDFISDNLVLINEGLIGLSCNYGMIKNALENNQIGIGIAGTAGAASSLFAILVKEKPISEQSPEMLASPLGKVIAWMQAYPYAVNGAGNAINSAGLFLDPPAIKDVVETGHMNAAMPSLMRGFDENGDISYRVISDKEGKVKYVSGKHDIGTVLDHYDDKFKQQTEELKKHNYGTDDYKKLAKDLDDTQKTLRYAERQRDFVADGNKSWQIPAAMSTCYVLATATSFIASKEKAVRSDPFERYEELLVRTAQRTMNIPEGAEREKAIALMSVGLAANPEVKGLNANQIAEHIAQEITDLQHNPFNSVGKNNIVNFKAEPKSSIETTQAILSSDTLVQSSTMGLNKS